ncbi:hypothetical protein NQZ68_003537 [Dissostichus eleginoides]|nr:hypothetical protein NQZ68_003537 [Dissostichus eleginoides]
MLSAAKAAIWQVSRTLPTCTSPPFHFAPPMFVTTSLFIGLSYSRFFISFPLSSLPVSSPFSTFIYLSVHLPPGLDHILKEALEAPSQLLPGIISVPEALTLPRLPGLREAGQQWRTDSLQAKYFTLVFS